MIIFLPYIYCLYILFYLLLPHPKLFGLRFILCSEAFLHPPSMKSAWNAPKKKGIAAKFDVPDWWPTINNKPVSVLYRILRKDMDDLNFEEHRAMKMDPKSDEFKVEILRSITKGSKERTPFWHCSTTLNASRQWKYKADDATAPTRAGWKERGSQPIQQDPDAINKTERVAIRIDILDYYHSGKMLPDAMIDISTQQAKRNKNWGQLLWR